MTKKILFALTLCFGLFQAGYSQTATIANIQLVTNSDGGMFNSSFWSEDFTAKFTYNDASGNPQSIRSVDTILGYCQSALKKKFGFTMANQKLDTSRKLLTGSLVRFFPDRKIKTAVAEGQAERIVDIDIIILAHERSIGIGMFAKKKFKPEFKVIVTVFDKAGDKLMKMKKNTDTGLEKSQIAVGGLSDRSESLFTASEFVENFIKAFDNALAEAK
jgi:hypothetical protein